MSAPVDAAGNVVQGSCCGGPLRPVSITAEGSAFACPCGRTTWTILTDGKLDYGIVRDSKLTDPAA